MSTRPAPGNGDNADNGLGPTHTLNMAAYLTRFYPTSPPGRAGRVGECVGVSKPASQRDSTTEEEEMMRARNIGKFSLPLEAVR